RDAARLLLLETVGIDPGQGAHERTLAVIDVPRRADNDRPHFCLLTLNFCLSLRPGRCLRRFKAFGTALLRRDPRSPSLPRSRTPDRPRSTCRISMLTRMTWTRTRSPRR